MARKSISIKASLVLSAIAAAAIIMLIGVIGVLSLQSVSSADRKLFESNTVPISHLLSVDESFQRARVNVRDYVLSTTPEDRQTYKQKIVYFRAKMQEEAAAYEKSITTKENRDLYDAWRAADTEYAASEQDAMGLADSGHADDALQILMGSKRTLAQSAADSLGKLTALNVLNAKRTADANTSLAGTTTLLAIAIGVAGIFVSLLLSLLISFSIARRLKQGVVFAEQIASGDLTQQLAVRRHDEIGRLVDALNGMSTKLKQVITTIQESASRSPPPRNRSPPARRSWRKAPRARPPRWSRPARRSRSSPLRWTRSPSTPRARRRPWSRAPARWTQVQKSIEDVSHNLEEICRSRRQVGGQRPRRGEGGERGRGRNQPDCRQLREDRGDRQRDLPTSPTRRTSWL